MNMRISYKYLTIYCIKLVLILMALFMLSISILAQEKARTITGIVLDDNRLPLAGATIMIAGTELGTVTDLEGDFQLRIPENMAGDTIEVSYVGYLTEKVWIGDQEKIEVILLANLEQLDEVQVVAVGYGTMRKSDLTGAISSVSSEDMKKGIITSTEQLLQGKIAGLTVIQGSGNPTEGSTLRLRGGTSLKASNGPLIVVDGIAGVDINTVQPSEIVSIDVLKDASSAAIYGSRGANGVIMITTNREEKVKTTEYSGYVAFGQVANHLDLLSANQWRGYVRENGIASAVDYGADTDWQRELEQTAITQSHNLSFSSGNKEGGFRASLNYLNNQGVITNTRLERFGASLSAYRYALNDRLKLDAGIFGNVDSWNPLDERIFERMYNLNPTIPVTNPDGSYTHIGGTNYENPVEIHNDRENDNSRNRMLGYGKAELEIIKGLKGVVNLSYELNSEKDRLYKPSYAIMEGLSDQGYAQRQLAEYTNAQLESYLTYEKMIGVQHHITILAGYSYLENVYEGFGAERRGYDTDMFLYNNLGAGQDYRAGDVYSYKGKSNLISFYGRANYSFAGRYMFTATVRRDGSSRFGDNSKWGLFPSASAAWRISDESFMFWSENWLNNLKLRVGYGVTGNQDGIGEYKSLSLLGTTDPEGRVVSYFDAATNTWKKAYLPVQNPNPDLQWESTAQFNIGLDFAIFKRLYGTLELYSKKTSDLLYTYAVPQPPYLVGTMLANVGDLTNKGVELSLNGIIVNSSDLNIEANLTFARNEQVVDRLSNQVYQTEEIQSGSLHNLRGMSNQFAQIIKEGYPVGTFWGPVYEGLDTLGNFIFKNDGESEYLGSVQPDFTMGFGTSLRYKMLDLEIATYGMFGQKVLNATAMSMSDPNRLPTQNVPDAFLESGIQDDPTFSSLWVEDASFFRIQSVSIGYTFSIKKIGIDKLRLYITGENLFVFTHYTGIDPEVNIDGLESPGMDMFNYYPKPRTISFGVNLIL
jgi:TonB-dependent starch-binding outer membrane protein SusC